MFGSSRDHVIGLNIPGQIAFYTEVKFLQWQTGKILESVIVYI